MALRVGSTASRKCHRLDTSAHMSLPARGRGGSAAGAGRSTELIDLNFDRVRRPLDSNRPRTIRSHEVALSARTTEVRSTRARTCGVFVDEEERIVVVTLYVYFNQRAKP